MTGLLEHTAELPVWVLLFAPVMSFMLGHAVRTELATRRARCDRCRINAAHHQRLTTRPAWLAWPGHHTSNLPFPYGDTPDPAWLEPAEKLPTRSATPLDDATVLAWSTEDQAQSWPPLDREGLLVEKLITQLEHLDDDTRQLENAR